MADGKPGPKSALDEELTQRICRHLRSPGLPLKSACELEGIVYETALEWVRRGKGNDKDRPSTPETARFASEVQRAIRESEQQLLGRIEEAANGVIVHTIENETTTNPDGTTASRKKRKRTRVFDWRAAEWLLAKRFPEQYGPKQTIEHTGTVQVKRVVLEGGPGTDPTTPPPGEPRPG